MYSPSLPSVVPSYSMNGSGRPYIDFLNLRVRLQPVTKLENWVM